MNIGDKVYFRPTKIASDELLWKLAKLGNMTGEIGAITGVGVCTVLLPHGVTIEGHSHPLDESRHYVDLHQSHLRVVDPCPRCGATGGRHKGGCALAPEMYKTPEGIPVRRTPRKYHGDFDG